jgi:hypothetical protein
VRSVAWKAECRTFIGITAFLRILPTAVWHPGAAEGAVLEPGIAIALLTAIGIETVIGIGIVTVIGMPTVMDIMIEGCIAGRINTIVMTVTATGIMTAVVTIAIRSTTAINIASMTETTTIAKANAGGSQGVVRPFSEQPTKVATPTPDADFLSR